MIKIKAKFVGRNSLGYVHNNTYDIEVLNSGFHFGGSQGTSITIRRSHSVVDGVCVYDKFEGFLKNWELISCQSMGLQVANSSNDDSLLMGVLTSTIRESKIEKILK